MTDVFDIADGAGGLWEIHRWNSDVELNTEAGGDPRIFVQRITGLHSLPERADTSTPKVARIGANRRPRNPLGKTVIYEGQVMASSLLVLRALRTSMLAAFADTVSEGFMDIIPQADDDSPTARFYADVLQLDPPEEIVGVRGFDRSYTLGLRLNDPRIYYPDLAVDETGNPVAVTNVGSAPADPLITVAGASGDVTIQDGTHTLTFANVPSGSLVIDFSARTAKVGAVHAELVVASSDWWNPFVDGIAAGATVSITQTGGTGVHAQFTPATWG